MDVLSQKLQVMDLSAITLCMDNKMPLHVFSLRDNDLADVVDGRETGTIIE